MPRIRTVKPEAFVSESLAEVSVEAERTFFGLLTQADDDGRHRDNAAIVAGLLWPLRAEHTAVHVEDDLQQLAGAGLICRYTGCDGRRYLHIATWTDHQKIDRPSLSRLAACPCHQAADRCAPCKGPCTKPGEQSPTTPPRAFAEASPQPPRALAEDSATLPGPLERPVLPPAPSRGSEAGASKARQEAPDAPADPPRRTAERAAGQKAFAETSPNPPRSLGDGSASGSRILDPGSSFPTGREAPDAGSVSAKDLLGEYVAGCERRPPGDVIGHLGRIVKKLLGEGVDPEHIRAGLRRFGEIQGHPSRLPSLVNDAMNPPAGALVRPGSGSTVRTHQAWTNPVDAATAYAEEL